MNQVYPKTRQEVVGLWAEHSQESEKFKILREAEDMFAFEGQTLNNYRRNKFWGITESDPNEKLICIEDWDLKDPNIKFFKE